MTNLEKIKKTYNKLKTEFNQIEERYKDNEITDNDVYKYNYLADKMRKLNNEHFFASHGIWLSQGRNW